MRKTICLLMLSTLLAFTAKAQHKGLESGTKAPNCKITNVVTGETQKLYDYIEEDKKVFITFLRPVWCPVCNLRTHEMIENYERLTAKGYKIIVVYPTEAEKLKKYAEDLELPYTVVADPDKELYQQYKIERSAEKVKKGLKHKRGKERLKKGKELLKKEYTKGPKEDKDLISADFVIDSEKKLLNVWYGEYMGDHLPVDTL